MGSKPRSRFSPGLLDTAGLIFIILQLAGEIDWSWWLVLLPWIIAATAGLIAGAVEALTDD